MVPALKNIVIVMNMLITPLPLSPGKMSGYAQSAVIKSESNVQITVSIVVHTNDL